MRKGAGFTLMELLVVMAVLAALAAVLFPVFALAREKARQTACLSNCRQIGTATMLYLEDYDGVLLPAWVTSHNVRTQSADRPVALVPWTELIQPYLKNREVFLCPSFDEGVLVKNATDPRCDGPVMQSQFPARHYFAHYGVAWGYSGGLCTSGWPRSRDPGNGYFASGPTMTLAEVVRPAETVVIQDNFTAVLADGRSRSGFGCEGGFRGAGVSRHHQGCNYVFLDGHAKLLTLDPRVEPTMPCRGAVIPGTSQSVPDCVCTRYTTFDY